jgi:hypothetical protein
VTTVVALLEALLERPTRPAEAATAERLRRFLAGASGLARFLFHLTLYAFDWTAFFFFGFERFSTLPLQVRKRYLRMWSRGAGRQVYLLLRTLVLGVFYDVPC